MIYLPDSCQSSVSRLLDKSISQSSAVFICSPGTTNRAECSYLPTRWFASIKSIQESARVWVSSGSLYIAQTSDPRRRKVREMRPLILPTSLLHPQQALAAIVLNPHSSPSRLSLCLLKAKAGHWVTWKSWWAILETNLAIVFISRPKDFRLDKGKPARQKDFRP